MSKEVTTIDQELLNQLQQNTPVESGFTRISLPRLGFFSQDKFEGKGKAAKLIQEAGMFYIEAKVGDEYIKTELGKSIELALVYNRKKLSYFDSATEEFISSSLFDSEDEQVTLFKAGKKLTSGYVKDLQSLPEYQKLGDDGKMKTKLELNRVLYVLCNGDPYELTIRGSSMWAFSTYAKSILWSSVLTGITSTEESKGSIEWNKMAFTNIRPLNNDELRAVIDLQNMIKDSVVQEKAYWASRKEEIVPPVDILAEFNMPKISAPEF